MTPSREKLLRRAGTAVRELKLLDFKSEFDVASAGAWCEVIKDIVAFANSGGGVIVFGVADDGSPSNYDSTALLGHDTAQITTRIARYTNYQFGEFEILEVDRSGRAFAAILIGPTDIPMVFIRPGTYEVPDTAGVRKQKTAFGLGDHLFPTRQQERTGQPG